jgi:hypothetical protein
MLYKKITYNMTERVYRQYINKINPNNLNRTDYHLDHIYSILEGFKNNIPPYIISDLCNLQMIPRIDNIRKNCRCDMTKEELMIKIFDKEDAMVAEQYNGLKC